MTERVNGIPAIGLGTFGLTGAEGLAAMQAALAMGYRHIDTAQSYGTEENTGKAVASSSLPRDRIFVTTKITGANLGRIGESVDESLATMGLAYADLILIHWPAPKDSPPVRDYIGALARVQDAGKARLIGVSNFTRRHVDEAVAELGEGRIATNQVERHVFLQNQVLADHCTAQGIAITAYLPLARNQLDHPDLRAIADRHGVAPSRVALAFNLALGSIVIPKSGNPDRQADNLAAAALRLTGEEIETLRTLDRGERHIDPDGMAPDWD